MHLIAAWRYWLRLPVLDRSRPFVWIVTSGPELPFDGVDDRRDIARTAAIRGGRSKSISGKSGDLERCCFRTEDRASFHGNLAHLARAFLSLTQYSLPYLATRCVSRAPQ